MAELLIRDAHDADREAIRTITVAAYAEYAAEMMELHWQAYQGNILFTLDEVAPAEQLVAEIDGSIVGTVLLYPPRRFDLPDGTSLEMPWPEVRLLAVPPAGRGHGVGAALMRECVRRARASGATSLGLHTTPMMRAAMRMYERMGFVRAPEIDFHPMPGLTISGYRLVLE